jgi:hypothetical protein
VRVASAPLETDAPLAIDPDAVLAFAVAFEHFKFVAGRNHQIFQPNSRIEQSQLGQGRLLDIAWQPARVFAIPDLFGFTVAKTCDHTAINYSCEYIRQANTLQIVIARIAWRTSLPRQRRCFQPRRLMSAGRLEIGKVGTPRPDMFCFRLVIVCFRRKIKLNQPA